MKNTKNVKKLKEKKKEKDNLKMKSYAKMKPHARKRRAGGKILCLQHISPWGWLRSLYVWEGSQEKC